MNISTDIVLTPESRYALGRATITISDPATKFQFAIKNISIHSSLAGNYFIRFPSEKSSQVDEAGRPKYFDVCYPTNAETRQFLTNTVVEAYCRAKQNVELRTVTLQATHFEENVNTAQANVTADTSLFEDIGDEIVL